jgi:hypothetical protein
VNRVISAIRCHGIVGATIDAQRGASREHVIGLKPRGPIKKPEQPKAESLQKASIDMAQAKAAASERCRAWGYSDAEPFGGETRQCQAQSQYGCVRWFVTLTYQCLGGNRPT